MTAVIRHTICKSGLTALAFVVAPLFAAPLLVATPASAATPTWVSSTGNDGNSCTREAPCRKFAAAIAKTDAGGEIDCVDPADYGTLTITKAITIACNGIGNGAIIVTSFAGQAITVQAGAGDTVVLDGLVIAGKPNTGSGIDFQTGAGLIVRNTVFRNLVTGIRFAPQSGSAKLSVEDSSFVANGGVGIYVIPVNAADTRAGIVRSQFSNGGYGIVADGTNATGRIFVTLRASSVMNSRFPGIFALNGKAANATVSLEDVSVSGGEDYGLYARNARAGFLVNNSTINGNQGGGLYTEDGGVIYSYGNNRVNGNNGKDGAFTATLPQR